MNTRIQELLKQATKEVWGNNPYNGAPEYEADEVDQEKFAELIIRECAELIDNKEMITALQTYDEVFVAKYDTKEQCSKQILKHFGVEQ